MLLWIIATGCDAPRSCDPVLADQLRVTARPVSADGVRVLHFEADGHEIACDLTAERCGDGVSGIRPDGDTVVISLWDVSAETVVVSYTVDGAEVHTETVAPEYTEDDANGGPDCAPRYLGEVEVSLAAR